MRIISGKFRGKKLAPPRSPLIRPTSDRAREAIFNILGNLLDEKNISFWDINFVDVFAGTGALGFEALSRGAQKGVFIDPHPEAHSLILANIDHLHVKAQTFVLRRDACLPLKPVFPADLAFFDPPYGKGLFPKAFQALDKTGWFSPSCLFVVEVGEKEADPELSSLELLDKRFYGAAKILFFHKKA